MLLSICPGFGIAAVGIAIALLVWLDRDNPELHPDAWARFERAAGVVAKARRTIG
jgi:hypothetical protein